MIIKVLNTSDAAPQSSHAQLTMVQIRMARSVTMAGAVKLADSAQLFAQLASVLMECTSLSHALSSLELQ
jgi:hypothetical protein